MKTKRGNRWYYKCTYEMLNDKHLDKSIERIRIKLKESEVNEPYWYRKQPFHE